MEDPFDWNALPQQQSSGLQGHGLQQRASYNNHGKSGSQGWSTVGRSQSIATQSYSQPLDVPPQIQQYPRSQSSFQQSFPSLGQQQQRYAKQQYPYLPFREQSQPRSYVGRTIGESHPYNYYSSNNAGGMGIKQLQEMVSESTARRINQEYQGPVYIETDMPFNGENAWVKNPSYDPEIQYQWVGGYGGYWATPEELQQPEQWYPIA